MICIYRKTNSTLERHQWRDTRHHTIQHHMARHNTIWYSKIHYDTEHVRTTCRCLVMAQFGGKNSRPYGQNICDFVSIKGSLSDTPVSMWLTLASHQEFNGNICSEDRTRGRPSSALQFYLFPGINISLSDSISEINTHWQEVITGLCTFHATATFFDCLMCWFCFFFVSIRIIRLQQITSASCWNYFLAVRRQMEMFGYKLSLFFFLLLHNKSRADTCLRGSVRILKVLFWSSSSENSGAET